MLQTRLDWRSSCRYQASQYKSCRLEFLKMADAHRSYADGRHPALPALLEQRPHLDSDVRRGQYFNGRDDGRGAPLVMGAGNSLGAPYDCCPCGEVLCLYSRDEITIPVDDQRIMCSGGSGSAVAEHQSPGVEDEIPVCPLPPDASCTLFVLGVPLNCSRREVHHIFRIFTGYKDIRLVDSHSNGEPLVYCFVDFEDPHYAFTAMHCLQGYMFDETDMDSTVLTIQFAQSPDAVPGDLA